MWTRQDNGRQVDWEQASAYCEALDLGGFSDWRLPTAPEVADLFVPPPSGAPAGTFGEPRIEMTLSTCCVWTSTTDERGRNQFFSFFGGKPGRIVIKAIDAKPMRAICVREGG